MTERTLNGRGRHAPLSSGCSANMYICIYICIYIHIHAYIQSTSDTGLGLHSGIPGARGRRIKGGCPPFRSCNLVHAKQRTLLASADSLQNQGHPPLL